MDAHARQFLEGMRAAVIEVITNAGPYDARELSDGGIDAVLFKNRELPSESPGGIFVLVHSRISTAEFARWEGMHRQEGRPVGAVFTDSTAYTPQRISISGRRRNGSLKLYDESQIRSIRRLRELTKRQLDRTSKDGTSNTIAVYSRGHKPFGYNTSEAMPEGNVSLYRIEPVISSYTHLSAGHPAWDSGPATQLEMTVLPVLQEGALFKISRKNRTAYFSNG